jgi:hypothetical protein
MLIAAVAFLLFTQTAPEDSPRILVTREGLQVEPSSRRREHARQIEVARQLWREVCVERPDRACAAPDQYVVDVDVHQETSYYCAGTMRLARTAPEYPSGNGLLPGVQFHCFGAGPRAERRIMTIDLSDADSQYLDWPPMPGF